VSQIPQFRQFVRHAEAIIVDKLEVAKGEEMPDARRYHVDFRTPDCQLLKIWELREPYRKFSQRSFQDGQCGEVRG